MMTLKMTRLYALVITLAFLAVACGGGSHSNPGNGNGGGILPSVSKLFVSTLSSAHLKNTGASRAGVEPYNSSTLAWAQSPSVVINADQSFEANCNTTPTGIPEFVMPQSGTGQPNCAAGWQSDTLSGESVLGNGTLEYLICQGEHGTSPTAGRCRVYILRNGVSTLVANGECTVGTGDECRVALNGAAIQDRDKIVIKGGNPGAVDNIQNLRGRVIKKVAA